MVSLTFILDYFKVMNFTNPVFKYTTVIVSVNCKISTAPSDSIERGLPYDNNNNNNN